MYSDGRLILPGYFWRLDQAIPCALEHRVALVIRKIAINNQVFNMVKVYRDLSARRFGIRWSMAPEFPGIAMQKCLVKEMRKLDRKT